MSEFECFCYENDIVVRFADNLGSMPRGFSYYYNGTYYVILNSKHTNAQCELTVIHEVIHVMENHFEKSMADVDQCENDVIRLAQELELCFL